MPARELGLAVSGCCVGATLLFSCGQEQEAEICGAATGLVSNVVDGDTIDLESGARIRYLLVDTPEIAHSSGEVSECFGDEAAALNEQLVLGQEVILEYDAECEDRYDRTLAYVYRGDRMINAELIGRGYARLLVIPPNEKHVQDLSQREADARSAGRGLWGSCP
jgi:micrococcal nuclease